MRKASIERKTGETQITASLTVEGKGDYKIRTPIGFFTHMLEAFSKHGLFDMQMDVKGDLEVDQHHTVEDTGIVIGSLFKKALGDKKGINRAGFFIMPLDESLAQVAIDIGGRPYLQYSVRLRRRFCGDFDTDLLEDFFEGMTTGMGANIMVTIPYGRSDHHKIEAVFKALGRAMKMACSDSGVSTLPSTKGVI